MFIIYIAIYCNVYLTEYSIILYKYIMIYIPRLAEEKIERSINISKVLILLGARQVGKTTLLKRVLERYNGIIFNLDIEVDKARLLIAKDLSPTEAINSLGNPQIIAIDEAQRFPEISRIVKSWFDAGISTKFILSGSSSLNLLDQAAEALTGRNEKVFLTPFLFKELISIQSWFPSITSSLSKPPSNNPMHAQVYSFMMQNLVYGSFPEAVTTENKMQYLLNLSADYLLKDIFQSGTIKNPDFVKRLLLLLAHQVGSEVSTSELASNLGVGRQTIEKYLDLLEQTFVVFRLGTYSTNLRKEVAKSKKIYFWDTGVRNAILKEFNVSEYRSDIGILWENWVIAEFAKYNAFCGNISDLYFWRSRDGAEVDLIVKSGEQLQAFEIKWSSSKTTGTNAFTSRYKVTPLIITKDNFLSFLYFPAQ